MGESNNIPTNQCDGCCQGNEPDELGFHRSEDGYPFMLCTKGQYDLIPTELPSDEVITEWRISKGWHNLGITELIKEALVELGGFNGPE